MREHGSVGVSYHDTSRWRWDKTCANRTLQMRRPLAAGGAVRDVFSFVGVTWSASHVHHMYIAGVGIKPAPIGPFKCADHCPRSVQSEMSSAPRFEIFPTGHCVQPLPSHLRCCQATRDPESDSDRACKRIR
eukprot:3473586-Rhodomonas_salina.5